MKYTKRTLVIEKGHTLRLPVYKSTTKGYMQGIEDSMWLGRAEVRTTITSTGYISSNIHQIKEDTPSVRPEGRVEREYEHIVNHGYKIPQVTYAGDMLNARVWVTIDRIRYGNPVTPEGEVLETDLE